jgi:hypothetical protein
MLAAIEFIHMIKKRQTVIKAGEVERTVAEQFYRLAAYSPQGQGQSHRHATLTTELSGDVDDQ